MTIFRFLEVLEGTFIRTYMRQSCSGCIVEVFCVVGMQETRIPTLKCRFYLLDRWGTYGQKGRFFDGWRSWRGLTFVRTYEAKLFGMHDGKFSVMWTSHGSQPFRR